VGLSRRYPPQYAALLNGAFAHSMDFDDTHRDGVLHIGASVFSTLLALAEQYHASGRDFLRGAIVGYEVAGRLGRAFGESIHRAGFHPTGTTGIFAASAAGAVLLGLKAEELRNCWGINLSQAAGSQQFLRDGSWNKRLHPGFAAHDAIVALSLARAGYRGVEEVFEGEWGYAALYARGNWRPEKAFGKQAGWAELEIMTVGVKPYPCCRYLHPVIDAVVELIQRNEIKASDVRRVQVALPPIAVSLVAEPESIKRRPISVVDGQFSAYFIVAATLVEGEFSWECYRYLADESLGPLMDRIHIRPDSALGSMQADVIIETGSGVNRFRVLSARGEPDRFPTFDETRDKLEKMAGSVIGSDAVRALAEMVMKLDSVESMSDLTVLLRP
jgi:2-methylcitrate dehydratase PrpD